MKRVLKKQSQKALLVRLKKRGGRSRQGRITVRHRGGGSRKLYRHIEFGQAHFDVPGKVVALEYDPNRNAHIALVDYGSSRKAYVLAPHELQEGDEIVTKEAADIKTGNRMRLGNIPVGTMVHNVELEPGRGGKLARGAGTSVSVLAHEAEYTHVQMPSTETRKVPSKSFASIGVISNAADRYKNARKAGSRRKKGWRPKVRGTAMNPVDHPHGGGEGRTGRGMKHPKTPWGKPALGVKTRKKKWSNRLIVQRRKKKKKKK
jgi:large subunit ribosomal protein L2